MNALRTIAAGAAAGAAGTAVLNGSTYVDMAVRGRPPNRLPQRMAQRMVTLAGFPPLGPHRETGFGALFGYADGLALGVAYALARPKLRGVPLTVTGAVLGLATMVLSNGSAVALGEADPLQWPTAKWLSELIPRCLYGWVTCAVLDRLITSWS